MSRFIPVLLSFLLLQGFVSADNCSIQMMLEKKIKQQTEQVRELEAAIMLNDKLEQINSWPDWTNIQSQERRISLEEAKTIFSAKEIDILLLADTLSVQEGVVYKDLTVNVGVMAGSITTAFITARVINKLLRNGYKSGFMVKVQKMIGSESDNPKKARKVKMVTSVLSVITPVYLGYKEYELYKMLKGIQKKLEMVEELNDSLPELEILQERIETDRIMLRRFQAENGEKCS